ncbi:MAG TPA: Gfo/Idh/MocA family oxidoreductase [Melioribacteraceae bacterium]|nr:Gfo/Idh/MocA family oxidoreductase [Melioribacteraceae bacterium]
MESKKSGMELNRRNFIKSSAILGAGLFIPNSIIGKTSSFNSTKKRYAIVGVGHRTLMYQDAVYKTYKETSEIVGMCDVNEGRLKFYQDYAKKMTGKTIPIYLADEFDKMIKENKPEVVIVTTVDATHHLYIIRAMELGCDVITEKPMTTDEIKCQQIIDAQNRTGKKVIVTFNYRYSPPRTQVKDLLMSGAVGDLLSVDFHWMLNTHHGADYYRRWHGQKKYSGGLMVHKATHHFDLVNWWLSATPVKVYANGKKEFYTPETAKRMGLKNYYERCYTCPEKSTCAFELSFDKNERLKKLYLDNEKYDGYFRDRCVFRPEIDIEDTMNVVVSYDNNVTMSYSLNSFNSWEGYYIVFNGTKGRLEHKIEEKVYFFGDANLPGETKPGGTTIRVYPLRGNYRDLKVWEGEGSHGGGDKVLLEDLFGSGDIKDKYLRAADYRAGAYSCLTGIAANKSIKDGRQILIDDLVKNLKRPDYTPMPSKNEILGMPNKNL